jgi:hypothetical protein
VACCREFGIECSYLPDAAYADLCLLGGPARVLVKNEPDARQANHWVVVLSATLSEAEVYDPSVGVIRVSAAELQSLWGGPAVIVYAPDDGRAVRLAWGIAKILLLAALAGITVLVLRLLARTRLHPGFAVLVATVTLATLAHTVDPAGFAHNTAIIQQIQKVRQPRVPDVISPGDLMTAPGPVLVVDARTPPTVSGHPHPGCHQHPGHGGVPA